MRPEDIAFLQPGQSWPPVDSVERLNRYIANQNLFAGKHNLVYKDWARLFREDLKATIEIITNFPGAVSKLYSDLLFGELPKFKAADAEAQEWLDDFVERNRLHQLNYAAALAQSYRGEAIYKLRLIDGEVVAEVVPATIWFPIVDEDNVTEALGHVLAWVKTVKAGNREVNYLRAEIHFPGSIHQRAWVLKNNQIGQPVELSTLYANPPEADQLTGVDEPLIVVIPNLKTDDTIFGQDDYSEADTLFQELNARLSQISRVLDKHTDPNMYGPDIGEYDPATGATNVRMGGKYFTVPPGENPPGYLTWDAQLSANWEYLDRILNSLYIVTDTNAAAFSLMASGSVPSGAALKRLLLRPLARTNRKRLYFETGLKRLFKLAAKLAGKDIDVEIEWQDGLPQDPYEAAQIEQIRTGGKATSSVRSAIMRLDGVSREGADAEIAAIAEDEAQGQLPAIPSQTEFSFGEE